MVVISNCGSVFSKSFMQFSASLTNINLITVFTSNSINYSFCFTIIVTGYCNFFVPSVLYFRGF